MLNTTIKNITAITAAISGLTIILAIIYNLYFFDLFDKDFIFEMTISDHVATGITFVPTILIAYLLVIIFFISVFPKGSFTGQVSKEDNEKIETFRKKYLIHIDLGFSVFALILWFQAVFFDAENSPRFLIVILMLSGPIVIRYLADKVDITISIIQSSVIYILIGVCLGAALLGHSKAVEYLDNPKEVEIVFKDSTKKKYNYVRRINNGVIVYNKNTLSIISADEIASISQKNFVQGTESTACNWIGVCLRNK